ncbi:MAG: class I SAM-dependent methyltransferase [Candidatus Omnitrophota bacterium]|jgi:ubiquinone/menaquinone biosynthesis C-methylase UbiE
MSIKKARIYLTAKLKMTKGKLIAKIDSKEIILNKQDFLLLSSIDNKNLQDLSRPGKKNADYRLKKILDFEKLGLIKLKFHCEDALLKFFYQKSLSDERICKKRPAFSNIKAYEKEWNIYPKALNFLNKKSENYKLKNFETEIYLNLLRPFLNKIPKGSTIIDAGGGIGRFGLKLIKMGYRVHLLDSSEIALKKALRHLQAENLANFDLYWGDATNLSMFSDNTFDAAFAIELICYCDRPDKIVSELVRVTKKNGLIVISVEGKYGGLISDPNASIDKLISIFKNDMLHIKKHLYVHYYTPKTLVNLLKKCGIKIINIFGCHYVLDGILHHKININKLGNKEYRKYLLDIENLCSKEPVLKKLARAWLIVGRK